MKSPRARGSCYAPPPADSASSSTTLKIAKNIEKAQKGSFKGNSHQPFINRIGKFRSKTHFA